MKFEILLKKIKIYSCLEALFGIFTCVNLINTIIYWNENLIFLLAMTLISAVIYYFVFRRKQRYVSCIGVDKIPSSMIMERYFDKYVKRLINWILIAFLQVGNFLISVVSLGINSKLLEVLGTFNESLFIFEIIAFFIIKNIMLLRWLLKVYEFTNETLIKKTLKKVIIGSLIFWGIALGLFYLFEYVFVINILSFLRAIYIIGIIAFNIISLRKIMYSKSKSSLAVIAVVLIIATIAGGYTFLSRDIWMTQPYINSIPNINDGESKITYDDASGIYTITKSKGDFKILQLTDIHLGGSVLSYDKDLKALKAVYKLINRSRPDFVIVTGDLVFPVGYASFSFNNTAPVQQFAAFMRNLGIPWAFTYGNHDTEKYATMSESDLNELYKSLSWKTSKTLLYPYKQPNITGRNNQLIELRNEDGSLNQALFLIDSNAYTKDGFNKYDYIHDDQVEWYKNQVLRMNEEEGRTILSMVFFHIPLQEYREAYNLYESGSDEVKYFFGSNDEKMINKVCCSEYPSKLFDTAKELGSTTGFFCGHDHYNNMSLEYQGIRLTYGMSIDYLAMPGIARDTKQRGGTLITVHDDGTSNIEQLPLEQN
ncbi:metallophosphoesterase family protein [Clostridium sp. MSJ-8]|uniref:metallophosphoesterase family protein n=1 Tax=Clostridium sp. MSJ-8 TaxID=2841510 RepID=UPI001C0F1D96|nr:metallophosphoesterase family protein [Clostridium sp. MSJ-8]MBU5487916.1 metallophosphoesterase family protein [Clostridium sp. MSJ-8]